MSIKKRLFTTSAAVMVIMSGFSIPAVHFSTETVQAATSEVQNPYNNQAAVNAKADEIIETAKSLIGKATYADLGAVDYEALLFRCASFMDYVFLQNGVDLANADENHMFEQGYAVPRDQLQKGDLVFFDSTPTNDDPTNHAGIYIGDNKIIHMANKKLNVTISDLDSTSYYKDSYVGARRVLPSLLSANPETKGDKIVDTAFSLQNQVKISSTINNKSTSTFTNGGFVNYIFEKNGINLGSTDIKEQISLGKPVSKNDLKKGDLVFFNYTTGSSTPRVVGIYAGDHRLIMSTEADGVYARVDMLDWYQTHYITARRVISDNESVDSTPKDTLPETDTTEKTPVANTQADNIINFAKSLIGKATFGYKYDEKSLTFTSGGFTKYVYKQYGVDLKSTSFSGQVKLGQEVQKTQLQKGDLIFFSSDNSGTKITQAGIYMGDNQYISLNKNSNVTIQSLNTDWASKNYVTARNVLQNSSSETPVAEKSTDTQDSTKSQQNNIVNFAESLIGKATFGYKYDEKTMTFTAGGFTKYVFKQYGVDLKSTNFNEQAKLGQEVQKDQLQKGDLIFFSSDNSGTKVTHVGIYMGDNQYISLNKNSNVTIESLNTDWVNKNYVTARNVL